MATDELKMLNPQIVEVTIGIRVLRQIKLYPLSMADQLTLTSLIVETIQKLFAEKEGSNIEFANTLRLLISDNLGKIMTYVTDEGEVLLKDISNSQACDIAEQIYEVNYEILEKKVMSLLNRVKKGFLLPKSQQPSSEDTPSTDSNISIEEGIEKED